MNDAHAKQEEVLISNLMRINDQSQDEMRAEIGYEMDSFDRWLRQIVGQDVDVFRTFVRLSGSERRIPIGDNVLKFLEDLEGKHMAVDNSAY